MLKEFKVIVDEMRGTNSKIEAALDQVFTKSFEIDGKRYPVIPQDTDLEKFLQDYLKSMSATKD
jgi:hypothetical protein